MGHEITRRKFLELTAGAATLQSVSPAIRAASEHMSEHTSTPYRLHAGLGMPEPYKLLSGGEFSGSSIPESRDPLVRYRWSNPEASDDLQIYTLLPVRAFTDTPASFENLRSASDKECEVLVQGRGSVCFDFGVESAAWLEFDSPDMAGSVEMSISEYNEPGIVNSPPSPGGDPEHRIKTMAPRRYGNTFRLELNKELYEGVRFGWIHVRGFDKPWHITAVRAVCQVKPTNYNGQFSCSDEMLTRIWYTGAYGVKVNLCKDYFGAILMDRGDRISWTGDAHPAQDAALVAFGDWNFIRQNLERTATSSNGIESYSLYWILSLLNYYQHTGDVETLKKYIGHVQTTLNHASDIYSDPNITFYGHDERLGACFEEPDRYETKTAYRMLFVRTCNEFSLAMDSIGRNDFGSAYREIALQKMKEFRSNLRWFESFGVHALADAVNTGLTTKPEQAAMFAKEFSDRLNRLSYSPFNQYFILQAMGRMSHYDEAFVSILDQWGGQIGYGGTAFFEVYTPSWNQCLKKNDAVPNCQVGYTSLAHAWGGGVTAWLSKEVLGIRSVAPGFTKVDIVPHLGRTITWVSGSVPTPRGPVKAHFDVQNGSCEVTIPAGSVGRIGIPATDRAIQTIIVNQHVVWDGQFKSVPGVGGAKVESDFIYLNDVQPGRYVMSTFYRGARKKFENQPFVYPMNFVKEDAATHGNWGGVYGRDGYVLFDYDGMGNNRRRLPSYAIAVEAASFRKTGNCMHAQIVPATQDHRALAGDENNVGSRSVGQLYTNAPQACWETMTVDVTVAASSKYQIALYFLDWDEVGRRQAIEIFDLDTLKRITEVRLVQDFSKGKYMVYQCDRSIRVRINQVRGKNAVLNGMFFDRVATDTLLHV